MNNFTINPKTGSTSSIDNEKLTEDFENRLARLQKDYEDKSTESFSKLQNSYETKMNDFRAKYLNWVSIISGMGILGVSSVLLIPKLSDLKWNNVPEIFTLLFGYFLLLCFLFLMIIFWLKHQKMNM